MLNVLQTEISSNINESTKQVSVLWKYDYLLENGSIIYATRLEKTVSFHGRQLRMFTTKSQTDICVCNSSVLFMSSFQITLDECPTG